MEYIVHYIAIYVEVNVTSVVLWVLCCVVALCERCQASVLRKKRHEKTEKWNEMKDEYKYEMELSKVPVKVEQINEYLFSDTVQSQ